MTSPIWILAGFVAASPAFASAERGDDGRFLPTGSRDVMVKIERSEDGPELDEPSWRGARQLDISAEFVFLARQGLELLYLRRYGDARAFFIELGQLYPGTGAAPVGEVLVWQAQMMENYDYRYQPQWEVASRTARSELEAAIKIDGNQGWEEFMMTGVAGIEAIHAVRQGKYLKGLTLAFEAIDHLESAREAAPEFQDLMLADGMYNYWRTVITKKSPLLPDFGDHREEGVAQMRVVEEKGIFLAAPTTMALSFAYYEDGKNRAAIEACERNRALYPENTINLMMLGASNLQGKNPKGALEAFDALIASNADNQRVHYYRGKSLQQLRRYDEATAAFETYLGFARLEDSARGWAYFRLGQIASAEKRWSEAEIHFKESVRVAGNKSGREELDKIKKGRREGRIPS